MDVKITSGIWGHREIESADADVKLAALWLLTNQRVNLVGYAEITERRFAFETGLPCEALAKTFEALPDTFRKTGEGYWIRGFIRRQLGRGDSLVRNNYCKPLLRDLKALASPSVVEWVLEEYPELKPLLAVCPSVKGSARAPGAPEKRRAEKSREEQSGEEQRDDAKTAPAAKGRPADQAEVIAYFASLKAPSSEAEKFFDHFEANGWRQGGRSPLRSWQSAANNWVRRWREGGGSAGKNAFGGRPPDEPAGGDNANLAVFN